MPRLGVNTEPLRESVTGLARLLDSVDAGEATIDELRHGLARHAETVDQFRWQPVTVAV